MRSAVSPASVLDQIEHLDLPLPGLHKKRSRAKGALRWTAMVGGAVGVVATALMWAPWRRRQLDQVPATG
jgi:hypothetical protein